MDEKRTIKSKIIIEDIESGEKEVFDRAKREITYHGDTVEMYRPGTGVTNVYNTKRYKLKFKETNGGCFLTTACVDAMGLSDNCTELQTLRGFRDEELMGKEEGEELIEGYNSVGPKIVEELKNRDDGQKILQQTYHNEIVPILDKIDEGRSSEAIDRYINMVQEFERKLDL